MELDQKAYEYAVEKNKTYTQKYIAKKLNRAGYRTKNGYMISQSVLSHFLRTWTPQGVQKNVRTELGWTDRLQTAKQILDIPWMSPETKATAIRELVSLP